MTPPKTPDYNSDVVASFAAPLGSAATCGHIIAYADERDAFPCQVCEAQRLRNAMRHVEFWHYPPTGVGWTTCRGCGCISQGKNTSHKSDCPFRFWLDDEGRVVMSPNKTLKAIK